MGVQTGMEEKAEQCKWEYYSTDKETNKHIKYTRQRDRHTERERERKMG